MVAAQPEHPPHMSEAEYLRFEADSPTKHEYAAGQVYAMAGAGWNHNLINGNTQTALNNHLARKPCAVVSSDMRLKVTGKSVSYRYPDTMVICGEPQFAEKRNDTILNPTVIVEIVSPSTALTDHNEKLDEYLRIESVQDYVLIAQHEAKVEVYSRQHSGRWLYTPLKRLDAMLELHSIGCVLPLETLYAKVNFEQATD
jgi:Uma2 family endonuclease